MIELEVGGKKERIRRGLHICQFYNEPLEISQTAVPLLRDGLRVNEKCWVAAPAARVDEIRRLLRAARVDTDEAQEGGRLTCITDQSELLSDGRFDPYYLLSAHQALISKAINNGYEGVRAVIDMAWLGHGAATADQILKYEAAADAVFTFQNRPIVALVQYNYNNLPGDLVVELLRLHPIAVVGRYIKRNPYYVNAEEYAVKIIRRSQRRPRPAA